MRRIEDVARDVQLLAYDPAKIVGEASDPDFVKQLAEMRLVALSTDGQSVLGFTKLGRKVLICSLWLADAGMTSFATGQGVTCLRHAAVLAARCIAFDEMTDDLKADLDAIAAEAAQR